MKLHDVYLRFLLRTFLHYSTWHHVLITFRLYREHPGQMKMTCTGTFKLKYICFCSVAALGWHLIRHYTGGPLPGGCSAWWSCPYLWRERILITHRGRYRQRRPDRLGFVPGSALMIKHWRGGVFTRRTFTTNYFPQFKWTFHLVDHEQVLNTNGCDLDLT